VDPVPPTPHRHRHALVLKVLPTHFPHTEAPRAPPPSQALARDPVPSSLLTLANRQNKSQMEKKEEKKKIEHKLKIKLIKKKY